MNSVKWLALALQLSIMLTVLGFGMTATWQEATYLLRTPKLLARTVVSMNIIMPIIAAVLASVFPLPLEVKAALVALALSPVPPIIQKSQLTAGGRREYVVGLMVAMSLIAIILIPVAVAIVNPLMGAAAVVAPLTVAKIMLKTVFAPLFVGLLIRQWFPAAEKASGAILAIASILLLIGVALLLIGLWPVTRTYFGNGVVLMLTVLAAIGLGVGHLMGGPLPGDRTVLAIATSSRHPAVALAIATSGPLTADLVKQELAVILIYVLVAMILGIPYKKWRERAKSEPLQDPRNKA